MRRGLSWLGFLFLAGIGLTTARGDEPKAPVTVESLLERMVDFRWLATPPAAGERTVQFSSYDRATKLVDGKIVNPFANGDANQYLRVEERDGSKEWVLADDDGPGYVSRIWSANPAGQLRIYIDGAEKPALAEDFAKVTNGDIAPFVHPYGHDASRGRNLYFPFPFAKHIKITTTKDGQYYQVSVSHLPADTKVESYSPEILKRAAAKIESVGLALMKPLEVSENDQENIVHTIAPGETAVFSRYDGPNAIVAARVKIDSEERDIALARSLLTMTFDDAKTPQVAVPLGDFFGSGPGVNADRTALSQVDKDGTMTVRWPMPYRNGCEIALTNGSSKPMTVQADIAFEPLPKSNAPLLYFHAHWRMQDQLQTVAGDGTMDWPALRASGAAGRFVGLEVNVFNPVTAWWGEGDEKVYVDGEAFPSTIGTGTEDYFGYAWCDPHTYQWPFHSESRCDGPGNRGNTSNVRYQILDSIPWHKSLAFDMEIWHWAAVKIQYASIAYLYAAEGAKIEPGLPDLSKREVYSPDTPVFREKGVIEGESLKTQSVSKGDVTKQDMQPFGEAWSGGEQLWWLPREPKAVLKLELPVETAGNYDIAAAFTKARDYGTVQFEVDGKPLGGPVDLFNQEVIHSGAVKLGQANLSVGTHVLALTITGKNAKSESYLVGLDWLKLTPASK